MSKHLTIQFNSSSEGCDAIIQMIIDASTDEFMGHNTREFYKLYTKTNIPIL